MTILIPLMKDMFGAFAAMLGFAFMLAVPRRSVVPTAIFGCAGFLCYVLLFKLAGYGEIFSYFAATVLVTVLCEAAARIMRMPATVFLLSALVPLVPGYPFYCVMLSLVQDRPADAAAYAVNAVQIVGAIAVGAAVTSVIFRAFTILQRKARGKVA